MAKKFENEKGFFIIEMNRIEAKRIGFGYDDEGNCLCSTCNKPIDGAIYYVACLNEVMDKECVEEYIKNNKHYIEDAKYEEMNYVFIALRIECYNTI